MAEERFLSRWARRKNAAQAGIAEDGEEAEASRAALAPLDADNAPPTDTMPEEGPEPDEEAEANRQAAEAVDLETIGVNTDMSVFFRKGVPGALKTAAMRQLWRSDPVFACIDGLNDYDTDFTGAGEAARAVITRWQVGKGFSGLDAETPGEGGEDVEGVDDKALALEGTEAASIANQSMTPLEGAGEDASDAEAEIETDGTLSGKAGEIPSSQGAVLEEVPLEQPRRVSLRSRFVLEDWPSDRGEDGKG
ncbi:DUF3306 domain-containing protein [Breoghania sp.]|uniref:DUF3306 domain-containing protein n=1 Tax=Breoghania sp. TaxID=2065378 RepID=UPI002AAA6BF1|nr:DUF3306 domain-containing protein [Breoghania sp.]